MESLIFDIDGTLWDSRALVAEGYNLQLHDEGLVGYDTDAEELKNSSKCFMPTHGLFQMPPRTLKSLNAI